MSQRTFGVAAANTTARRLSFYFAVLQVGTTLGIEAVSSLGSSLLALASDAPDLRLVPRFALSSDLVSDDDVRPVGSKERGANTSAPAKGAADQHGDHRVLPQFADRRKCRGLEQPAPLRSRQPTSETISWLTPADLCAPRRTS
jgi:hypothetical protein